MLKESDTIETNHSKHSQLLENEIREVCTKDTYFKLFKQYYYEKTGRTC